MTAILSRITVFPIKSLPGHDVSECHVLQSGGLEWDRRYALVGPSDRILSAKTCPQLHRIAARYDLQQATVCLGTHRSPSEIREFSLLQDLNELETVLSRLVGESVRIVADPGGGFPDDLQSPGPTVISAATLDAVAVHLGLSREESHRRFRSNLVVSSVPAFWEDRLFGQPGQQCVFQTGTVIFAGTNPCQRCAVPSRSSETGEPTPGFQSRLTAFRRAQLPDWSPASRFDHYYRLATNTVVIDAGTDGIIHVGDAVTILTDRPFQQNRWRPESHTSGDTE